MLVMTAKLTKKRIIAWTVLIGVIICAVIMVKGGMAQKDYEPAQAVDEIKLDDIDNHQGRIALLESFGWQVESQPIEFMEVQIPEEFDEVYSEYNRIQNEQGMDLKKYSGKRVMRYSYRICNYPTGEKDIIANILIYKGKLIGGDVCSPQLNGFMHGLKKT